MKNRSTAQGHREGGEREEGVGEKKRERKKEKSKACCSEMARRQNWAGFTAASLSGAVFLFFLQRSVLKINLTECFSEFPEELPVNI